MEGYSPLGLKRKYLKDVSDDFSDFSLTSPAIKIRRLDAVLLPIVEEPDVAIEFEVSLPNQQSLGSNSTGGIKIEELPDEPINEERAIVLFNPNNTNPLLQTPSNFSVSVNPSLVSGLKNQVLWTNHSNPLRVAEEETAEDNNTTQDNGRLAVVPLVQLPSAHGPELPAQSDNAEMMMEAQDMEEEATMEIEYPNTINQHNSGVNINEQFHQWQQHCLIPQPPVNTTTPIVWYP